MDLCANILLLYILLNYIHYHNYYNYYSVNLMLYMFQFRYSIHFRIHFPMFVR